MNNEETILDTQYTTESNASNGTKATQPKSENKQASWGEKAAYAVGGAVFGAGATFAGQSMAAGSQKDEVRPMVEESSETPNPEDSPAPEDSIIATATGVRVAQVDDDVTFAEAFADARAQVGPGGVFEWHGRAYGTYYKDEWDAMTPQERHDYQASIEYGDVLSSESQAAHHNEMAHRPIRHNDGTHVASHQVAEQQNTQFDPMVDDGDVRVLSVGQTDLNNDGVPEDAAVLEVDGHQILMVDIDHDGMADAVIADISGDGEITADEIYDVRDEHMQMPSADPGEDYLAQASNEPDYMNDANVGMYDA